MTMAAAVTSPENLLPIGYLARAGKGIRGAMKGGFRGGVAGATAGEVGLQAAQLDRDGLVSAASVAGSAASGTGLPRGRMSPRCLTRRRAR